MRTSEGSSNSRQTSKLSLLKAIEYTSLATSVIGVVASAVTQQVVYAAAPLSFSVFLNLVNRQRFEQRTQQNLTAAIAQVDQQLSSLNQNLSQLQLRQQDQSHLEDVITQLEQRIFQLARSTSEEFQLVHRQIQALASDPNPAVLQVTQQSLARLQNRINSIESLNLGSVTRNVTQLQSQYGSLLELTSEINQRLDTFPSAEKVDNLNAEINRLQVGLGQLIGLQEQHNKLQAEFSQLQALIKQLQERIGGEGTDEAGPELELLSLNLGIDFGTSFTKVCFRDIARDRSEVVTFTDGQATLDEALLPTKIGILPDGKLLAGLTKAEWTAYQQQDQTSVEFIKMRLADLDLSQKSDGWPKPLPELDQPETVENLCAYYLSRVITRTQSWIRRNKPDLVENQKIEWAANVGVPVEYCDSPSIARFEKVLSLAWLLSNEPQVAPFKLQSLNSYLTELRSRIGSQPIDCHAIPEISAAVWSFLNSREAREGFYVFFDVGDGTLDGVSFRYWREDGEPRVDFYSGSVKPLGVSALSQRIADELNASEMQVKSVIFNQSNLYVTEVNSSQSRKQIQQLVGDVVMEGCQSHRTHRPIFHQSELQNGLSIFIGGGGGKTNFYKQAIMSTHTDFQHNKAGIPSYTQKDVPVPKDLSMNDLNSKEFHRFAVAYGLSIPYGEGPDVRLPSQMENVPPIQTATTIYSPTPYSDT